MHKDNTYTSESSLFQLWPLKNLGAINYPQKFVPDAKIKERKRRNAVAWPANECRCHSEYHSPPNCQKNGNKISLARRPNRQAARDVGRTSFSRRFVWRSSGLREKLVRTKVTLDTDAAICASERVHSWRCTENVSSNSYWMCSCRCWVIAGWFVCIFATYRGKNR